MSIKLIQELLTEDDSPESLTDKQTTQRWLGYEMGNHPLEQLEELKLVLKQLMRPDVLTCLLDLMKVLDEGDETAMFTQFSRWSTAGYDCKYSIAALEAFKKKRLDRVIELVKSTNDKLPSLK